MALKLLRTIRLDPSDTFVFERAAESGEWAVPGAFVFWNADPEGLEGKARAAFRSGFLGISSLGWSTLVQPVAASEEDRVSAIEILAKQLVAHFGAPGIAEAVAAAEEEIAFAASLAVHPPATVIALQRIWADGEIRERFRTLKPSPNSNLDHSKARAFAVVADDGAPEEHDSDAVDLVDMAHGSGGGSTP